MMNIKYNIVKNEFKKIFTNKSTIFGVLLIVIVWSIIFGFTMPKTPTGIDLQVASNNLCISLSTLIGFFVTYLIATQVFLAEKREKTIETLLCTPLTVKEIWRTKSLATCIFAELSCLFSFVLLYVFGFIFKTNLLFPSLNVFIYLLIILPLFLCAISGLLGYIEFLFGMRENRVVNIIIIFAIIFGFNLVNASLNKGVLSSWIFLFIILGVSIILLFLESFLTKYLNKEKIVTSIEDSS